MAAPEAQPPPAELLTQLQDRLNNLCTMFFDFVGSLQRDAWPLPVSKDPNEAVAPPSRPPQPGEPPFDAEAVTARMAALLVEEFQATEKLIKCIPEEAAPEDEHYERIKRLQQEDVELSRQLAAAAAQAEAQLAELQRMFAALARQRLSTALLPPAS